MNNEKEIGKIIRELRGDLSLREFAKLCDVSHTTIDNIEKGVDFRTKKPTQVTINTLYKIAKATNVSVSYIIGENITKLYISEQNTLLCSEHEKEVLLAYKSKPEYQLAVDIILGIESNETISVYQAAHSEDNHPDGYIQMKKKRWKKISDAPETEDPLV